MLDCLVCVGVVVEEKSGCLVDGEQFLERGGGSFIRKGEGALMR